MAKVGRNDPCSCGSGKKYKKCCLATEIAPVASLTWLKMRRTEGEFIPTLLKHSAKFYGREAFAEAWDEFSLWKDLPMDSGSQPELDTAFLPWFVFNWVPDNTDRQEVDHLPEMPIAMHYLQTKASRLDPFQQRFIKEICSQPYSFFMVTDAEPGTSLTLRDLLLEREVTVHERQASITLPKATILFTRIITMDDASIMVGCAPTAIPSAYHNDFIDLREDMAKRNPNYDRGFLLESDLELRTMYYELREELSNPALPQLRNTDEEEFQLTKLYYTLTCSPRQTMEALITLSLTENPDSCLEDGKCDEHGELVSLEFPWLRKGNQQHKSWDNTVMGNVVIDGNLLTIEVNSQERADLIKQEIESRLGDQASFRNAVIQSSEKMMEEIANRSPGVKPESKRNEEEESPEVQAMLKDMSEKHWKEWLDTSIPALKDQTPREAVKTAIGRERLEVLLLELEGRRDSLRSFAPDMKSLRQELGLG